MLNADQLQSIGGRSFLGRHGNAWSAAGVSAGDASASLDTGGLSTISAFGSVSGATTITLQVSADGETWYDTGTSQGLSGAGTFAFTVTTAPRYVQLKSSGAVTITATLVAKG